jgi:hypothetical protein
VHSAYYLRAAGIMGGGMIVVVQCRGEEARAWNIIMWNIIMLWNIIT